MLTHWTRDRTRGERLPLEWVVKKQTPTPPGSTGSETAARWRRRAVADVNVIDYERPPARERPKVVADLPAGGRRLVQDAVGYVATVKSGETTFEGGRDTGRPPGRAAARGPLTPDR